jgi:stearoyl-CoA desaturase (delta-9 desaturase)
MHHAYSDTDKDPHSPHHTKNVFTMMWETKNIYNDLVEKRVKVDERFERNYPEWVKFEKFADSGFSRLGWAGVYIAFYLIFATQWWMFLFLPIHFLMGPIQGAVVNWSGHKYGYSNFDNHDKSKNSLIFDMLMLGELFQNNHHKLPLRANFAVKWFEFDPTYPVIWVMNKLTIIRLMPARI